MGRLPLCRPFCRMQFENIHNICPGSLRLNDLIHIAHMSRELGMDSAAITDHGVMYGVIDFYKAALPW